MARFGLVALGLIGLILTAGCGSSSPASTRCMTGCMRVNSVCSRTTDCAALCAGPSAPAHCTAAANAVQTCTESQTDATLCMVGTAGGPCSDEAAAFLTCVTTVDSGPGVDAGM
jgi:hypothetical protein